MRSKLRSGAGVVLALAVLTPLAAHADWNQANDEANRQRMQAEMRRNAEAADRANEDSLRRNQAAYANRPQASGGSSSSNAAGASSGGPASSYPYHSQGPASVVASYSFTVRRQESEAATVARIAAEAVAGNVQSQFNLGRIYLASYGATRRDDLQARKWFAAAAAQGHAPAQAQLGAMLYNGQGGPQDRAAGLAALKQASDQGDTYGSALYGVFTLQAQAKADPDRPQPQTVAILTKAADAGEVTAQDALGRIVFYLGVGAPRDTAKVIHYLTLAAAQDDAPSMFDLGSYYLGGSGVPRDVDKGLALVRSAADQGYGDAEALVGFSQVTGRLGLAKDVDGGVRRLTSSAAHGSAQGAYYLGLLSEDGLGVAQDLAAAAAYYRAGAAGGIADAQARYGVALIRGVGLAKDIPAGVTLIKASAEGGSSLGQTFLAKLFYEGRGVPKDRREAVRWFRAAAAQGSAEAVDALKDPSLADFS